MQNFKNIIYFISGLIFCLVLSACSDKGVEPHWDGQWQRTVKVPKNVQGRCFEESLTVDSKQWLLKVVVHSTFACNQVFLELVYEGTIREIKIKRDTDDRDVRMQIFGIHLVEMVDVAGDRRAALTPDAVKLMSQKYVGDKHMFFDQHVNINQSDTKMKSGIYPPVLDVAIPKHPWKEQKTWYKRKV